MHRRFPRNNTARDEAGFTLPELLISIVITSIIVGSLASAAITSMRTLTTTGERYDLSHEAQIAANYFSADASSTQPSGLSFQTDLTRTACNPYVPNTGIVRFNQGSISNPSTVSWIVTGTQLRRLSCNLGGLQSDLVMSQKAIGTATFSCSPGLPSQCSSSSTTTISITIPELFADGTIGLLLSLTGNLRAHGSAPPAPSAITPNYGGQGATARPVLIPGSNFLDPVTLGFSNPGITTAAPVAVISAGTTLSAVLAISQSAAIGLSDVTDTNPDGMSTTFSGAFTVLAAPVIDSVSPSTLGPGVTGTAVTILGHNFVLANQSPSSLVPATLGATVSFSNPGMSVQSVTINGATSITVNVNVSSGATAGVNDTVTVDNRDDGATISSPFTITSATPIASINPASGRSGTTVAVFGSGFPAGRTITVTYDGSSVGLSGTTTTTNAGTLSSINRPTFTAYGAVGSVHQVVVSAGGRSAPAVTFTVTSLTNTNWTVSTSHAGTSGVTYTYTFTTASGATFSSVTMTVPSGTRGTSLGASVTTMQPGGSYASPSSGNASLSGGILTFTFNSTYINPGTAMTITVTGLTNTATVGSYVAQVITYGNNGGGNAPVDTGVSGPIAITTGTLANPVWTVSTSRTGTAGVVYSYSFTTATAAYLTSVTMSVPPGTTGSPAVGSVAGLPPDGSATFSGGLLTYSFTQSYEPAGTAVSITITTITNTPTVGSYSAQLVTNGATNASAASSPMDSGITAPISMTNGTLTNPTWTVSGSATGGRNVIYTYTFTTTTGASLTSVTMTVPPGTKGNPNVGSVTSMQSGGGNGQLANDGSISLTGGVLTYTLDGSYVNPNTAVTLVITGLTNTTSIGTYTAQIVTYGTNSNGPGIPVDSGVTPPISIAPTTLTNPIWTVSSSATGATGVAYTYTFTTASGSALTALTMVVPPGTGGNPTAISTIGLPPGGTTSLIGAVLTYAFGGYVAGGTPVSITFAGLTNTYSVGSYTAQIVTDTIGTGGLITPVDSGVTAPISLTGGTLRVPVWTVSQSKAKASSTVYTYTFTTTSGAYLTAITATVPPGTSGTPTLTSIVTIQSGGASGAALNGGGISLAGGVLTAAFNSTYVNPSTAITMTVSGLTNTSTVGSYTAQIVTDGSNANGPSVPIDSGVTAPISMTTGALANPIWTVSASATGASGVVYTYTFSTATAATLTSVGMSVPLGTGGTPTVTSSTGLPTGGIASLAGGMLTYSFTPTAVGASTPASITVTGLTNTWTVDSYTVQLFTNSTSAAGLVLPVDSGVAAPMSITYGTLPVPTWTVSKSAAKATSVAYTYTFTTANGANLSSVTATVPPGTGGSPTVTTATGVPTGGSASLIGGLLTYTFNQTFLNGNTPVAITVTGLTNTSVADSYTAQLVTNGTNANGPSVVIDSGVTAPMSISAGTLTNQIWAVSTSRTGAAVIYTYTFKTFTSAVLSSVTMTVPPGTTGTPAVSAPIGVPTGGTVSLSGGLLTYAFTGATVNGATAVTIKVTGLANTWTVDTYSAQIVTNTLDATGATVPVDAGLPAPISISNGTLNNPTWTVSKAGVGASSDYTYTFTTATGVNLSSVTMTLPPGTTGAPTLSSVTGGIGGGSVALSGGLLTYAFGPTYLNGGTAVSMKITGLTNTPTAGTYTGELVTNTTDWTGASVPVDSAITPSVALN